MKKTTTRAKSARPTKRTKKSNAKEMPMANPLVRIAEALEAMNERQKAIESMASSFISLAIVMSDMPAPIKKELEKIVKQSKS